MFRGGGWIKRGFYGEPKAVYGDPCPKIKGGLDILIYVHILLFFFL